MSPGPIARRRGRSLPHAARAALGALALAGALPACTPLFLPPIPVDTLAPRPAWRVAGDAELRVVRDGANRAAWLRLRLRFDEVPGAAWVAVQWFGPAGGERASESLWVEPEDAGRTLSWATPSGLPLGPGTWRAVVSVDGQLLRQLEVAVEPDAP